MLLSGTRDKSFEGKSFWILRYFSWPASRMRRPLGRKYGQAVDVRPYRFKAESRLEAMTEHAPIPAMMNQTACPWSNCWSTETANSVLTKAGPIALAIQPIVWLTP
jgi:hypothetical protein